MGTVVGNWAGGHNYLTAVQDGFNRSGSSLGTTDTGQSWSQMYGAISLNSSHAVPTLGSAASGYKHSQLALVNPWMRWGSFNATVRLDHTHDTYSHKSVRLVFWYQDDSNQAYLDVGGRSGGYTYDPWTLNYVVNGTSTQVDVFNSSQLQNLFYGAIGQADVSIRIHSEGIQIYLTNVYKVVWNSSTYTAWPELEGRSATFTLPTNASQLTGTYWGIGFYNSPAGGASTGDTFLGARWVDNLDIQR